MILALLFHSFLLTCVEVIVVIDIVKPFLKGDVTSILEIMQGGWGADFATRFGGTKVNDFVFLVFFFFVCISYSQGATSVSAVPFTITVGETYALCDLDFETNLRKIDFAQVQQKYDSNRHFISFSTPGFL